MTASPQTDLQPQSIPTRRVFGDDLALPRYRYFTYIPAILLFAGALSWATANEFGLVFASVIATLVAFYTLVDWLFRRGATRFSTLLAMSLLMGYGFGCMNTWLSLPRGSLTLGQVWGLDEGILARGMGAVLFSTVALYFFGEIFEKPIFGKEFRFQIDAKMRTLVYAGALAMIIGYATHRLVISGVPSPDHRVSVVGSFIDWLYPTLAAISVAAFLTAQNARARLYLAVTAFVYLAFFAVLGRRVSIYTTIEMLVVLALVRYQWRQNVLRNILAFSAIGAVIVAGALVFMLLRIAPLTQSRTRQETTVRRFQDANRLVKKGDALQLASAATRQNVSSRTFILAFLANVMDASFRMTPALGRDAMTLTEASIPHAIFPGKPLTSEEDLVDEQFGFGYGDQANSVLTAGATDFGLAGMIVYPLLLIIFARLVYEFLATQLQPNALMVVALAFIGLFLATEATLTDYITGIRNDIIFGLVIAGFMALPKIRIRS